MKITIRGEEIELVNEPRHGIVRELRKMRNQMIIKLLTEAKELFERGILKENMKLEDAIEVIGKEKPELLTEFSMMQEDFNIIATISMATNRIWKIEDLDELTESEFWELYEKCKEAIGGTAEDFFARYEKNISYQKNLKT